MKKLDQETFDEIIYDECEPCLVIFTRQSCHVCQAVKPKLTELEADYGDRFGFYMVDVEEQPKLFQRFGLKGVPQVMFFRDGEFTAKLAGEKDLEAYEKQIIQILDHT